MVKQNKLEVFDICFSPDKRGGNEKFTDEEQEIIISAIKEAEKTLSMTISFSRIKPKGIIYSIPVIIEKISKTKFLEKHQNHLGMVDYPPVGTNWNGIDVKSRTGVVFLCPMDKSDLFGTVAHEVVHVFIDSFFSGTNAENKEYFFEGLTEWFTQFAITNNQKRNKNP